MSTLSQFGVDVTDTVGASNLAQYTLVKTAGALVVSADAADDCIGVVQDGADATDDVTIRVFGVTRVRAHGAISKFDALEPAASGRVDTHAGTSTDTIVGLALEEATAQDDEILALIGTAHMLAGPAA